MKRIPSVLLLFGLILSLCTPVSAYRIVDYALYTDVVAQIDGHPLRSYNIGGFLAVVAEDLRDYGFCVRWDARANSLSVSRESINGKAKTPAVWPDYTPPALTHCVGERAKPVYSTNIKTYIDGALVDGFNIGGETLVWLRDLSPYGSVRWDGKARESNLTLSETVPHHTLYVLMYHEVVDWEPEDIGEWSTTTKCLREDLQWLRDNGYTAYLPGELAAGVPLSERAVMITFDDGYASNCTLALPLLREYGMKAAVAVICGCVDRGEDEYLTWDMCREMADSGLIEFGSHTYDLHSKGIRRLSGESREHYEQRVLSGDLLRSIETLSAQTGQDIIYFAYPHGNTDSWASNFLAEHFAVTVTTKNGVANTSKSLYDLPRYNINTHQRPGDYLPAAPRPPKPRAPKTESRELCP